MITNNNSIHISFAESLLRLSRSKKNIIIVLCDYLLLSLSFWLSLCIRANMIIYPTVPSLFVIFLAPLIAIPIFYFFGLYLSLIRYANFKSLITITFAVFLYSIIWLVIVILVGIVERPYDFFVINLLLSIFFTGGVRYMARWFFDTKSLNSKNAIIYGAGDAGVQLFSALKYDAEINVVGFIDDDAELQGKYIEGKRVSALSSLSILISENSIDEIFLAMPSVPKSKITTILQSLSIRGVIIRKLPGINELASGKVSVADLKTIRIEDLLSRDSVKPDKELLKKDIKGKNILVTGAGGSIGSELCRQILKMEPSLLILFDISEYSLYLIERELQDLEYEIPLLTMLGDVKNQTRMEKILISNKVNTVYHTAAYKHVPMVEKNIIAGIRCNIFGTLSCYRASIKAKVDNFVFISTDKAVRPTNIMGATKRFAELTIQALAIKLKAEMENNKINTSIVRFGNVLGSSGSVVPLFREQIEKGGPITVTDPHVIRYFMTITEAAQLVIQAGAMGKEGEIFLLAMGEPIQVVELAKNMIRLSGMSIRDKDNLDGDIEIIFTGLRPGEKLYEELLVDATAAPTLHTKIMQANDSSIEWDSISKYLLELEQSIIEDDFTRIEKIFLKTVAGFKPKRMML